MVLGDSQVWDRAEGPGSRDLRLLVGGSDTSPALGTWLHMHVAWCPGCPGLLTIPPEAAHTGGHPEGDGSHALALHWAVAVYSAWDVGRWARCVAGITLGGSPKGQHLCAGQ